MSAKVVLKMHQSIDGFVCTASGDDSWLFPDMDEFVFDWETERLWRAGLHVMGRNLYEIMAGYWPTSKDLPAAPMNEIPKIVFSNTLTVAKWGPVRIMNGDLSQCMENLKEQSEKEILVHGGASFAQSLSNLGLIDEYRLLIHPVALGRGKPCITSPLQLQLAAMHRFPTGVVALTYVRK